MTYYREILRMYKQNIIQRVISSVLECFRNTVSRVIQKAQEDNLQWSDIENMSDQEIEKLLFPQVKETGRISIPEFDQYVLKPALEKRAVIRQQLCELDAEYQPEMPDIRLVKE